MKVVSVNISEKKGTVKKPVSEIHISGNGVKGDAHTGTPKREVSLLSQEKIDSFSKSCNREFKPGEFAENITFSDDKNISIDVFDRFKIGDVELEVTQLGKKCHGDRCAIFTEVGKCVMPKEGIFCKVIKGGTISPGDEINFIKNS